MVSKPDCNLILIATSQPHRAPIDAIISHNEADEGHVENIVGEYGQVCANHDRSKGKGVETQEYELIKLKVLAPDHVQERHGKMEKLLKKPRPIDAPPRDHVRSTNCFVLPTR